MVSINLGGLLLFFILLYSVKSDEILPRNNTEEYNNKIQQILEYLNSKSAIYLYKTANLLSAQNQESSEIILNFNVQVECRSENTELCAHTEFSCTTTLDTALNPMQKSLNCVPLKVETASSPTSDFIPIRRRQRVCPGCPVDLNPNARGIEAFTDAATKMIESESEYRIKPLKVLKVQRQVLATVPAKVRYILNIDFADTSCLKTSEVPFDECTVNEAAVRVCEVEFVDQTHLTRTKHIVKNNCTVVQDFVTESVVETSVFEDVAHGRHPVPGNNDMDNEIDVTYDFQKSSDASDNNERERGTPNYDAIAENGNADDILKWTNSKYQGTMQSKLEDIESQIIIFKDKSASATSPNVNSQFNVVTESVFIKDEIKKDEVFVTSSTVASDMTDDDKQLAIDGLIDLFNFDSTPKIQKATQSQLNVEFQQTKPVIEDLIIPVKAVIRFQESTDPKTETPIISVADTDSTIHITHTDSKYIDDKFNEEGSVLPSMSRKKRNLNVTRLQMEPTSEEEQEFVASLAELATQTLDNIDSDDHRRIVLKILNSKKVQSDGIVYYLTLKVAVSECSEQTIPDEEHTQKEQKHEIESDVNCRHRLLNDMTMICKVQVHVTNQKTEPKVIKSQCQVLRKTVERNNRTGGRSKRQILGAPLKLHEEDNYFKELAQEVLLRFDEMSDVSNQHKIIKVKNATRQLVAGTLVKMEIIVGLSQLRKGVPATFAARKDAKLLEDAQEKTCSVSIWDRPWIQSGRNISINCDEKNNNIKQSNMKQKFDFNEESYDIKLFNEFLIKHNKIYHSKKEYLKRYETFRKNLKIIKKLNDYEMGTGIYGPTKFADMNEKEYRRYLGLNIALKHDNHIPFPKAVIPDTSNLPKSFDWREKGAVTAVKNQGSCGSCWAFSVTGNIEGQYAIKNNKLLEFSEQELVDCDKLDSGCEGGLPDNAYRAIEQIGGLETESDYPYDAADEKCYFNSTLSKVQISGGLNISSNETEMAAWLVSHGPISIGINANAMQFYVGGISHPWKFLCDSKNLDHGVLIVGYGIKKYPLFNKTLPYWIVKNSWGRRWGEQGYYRVFRGDGTCGLNQMASSAVLGD